eukprot:jgi/Chrpa1/8192/Chrysochromulina_OHIO_Genome00011224-RA
MSPSFVPSHEYEKKVVARPMSASATSPRASAVSASVSTSASPVERVSAHTLHSKPSSLHTSLISLPSAPRARKKRRMARSIVRLMPRRPLGRRRACGRTGKSSVPLGTRAAAIASKSASARESAVLPFDDG